MDRGIASSEEGGLEVTRAQVLPTVLMFIDTCAGIVYLAHGDLKKFVYWIAAAVLTYTVTY